LFVEEGKEKITYFGGVKGRKGGKKFLLRRKRKYVF